MSVRVLVWVLALALLGGCSMFSDKSDDNQLTDEERVTSVTEDSGLFSIRAKATTLFDDMQKQEYGIYAPHHFQSAQESFNTLEDPAIEEEQAETVLKDLGTAQTKAAQIKPWVIEHLQATASAFKRLQVLRSDSFEPKTFKNLASRWKQNVQNLERSPAEDRSNLEQPELTAAMDQLAIRTMQTHLLKPTVADLNVARMEEAPKYAPSSFAAAEDAVELLNKNIKQHSQNLELITATYEQTQRAIIKATNTSRYARELVNLDPQEAEREVLEISNLLGQVGDAMGEPDHRHLGIRAQATALTQAAEIQRKRAQSYANESSWLNERAALIQRIQELERDASDSGLEATQPDGKGRGK